MNQPLAIETSNLTRKFGTLTAVNKISLRVPRNKIYGFLGPNGSGKSTTIRMLCGILSPTSGSIKVLDYEIPRETERLKLRMGYMTQKFSLYEDLQVIENLQFLAKIQNIDANKQKSRIQNLMEQFSLTSRQNQITGTLSGGQKQRLALAGAIIHSPDLLILDEPTSAVDPETRRQFWEYLFELTTRGITILVSTHYMDEAERCHTLAILQDGTLNAEGPPEQLMEDMNADVYLVRGETRETLSWMKNLTKNPRIPGCAQVGNNLRILVKRQPEEPFDSEQWLKRTFPFLPESQIQKTRPNIEDVFVRVTHSSKEAAP